MYRQPEKLDQQFESIVNENFIEIEWKQYKPYKLFINQ